MPALQKEWIYVLISIVCLDIALSREMIGNPCADTSPFSSYPTPDDLTKVGIAATKSSIEILCSCILSKVKVGYVGIDTFYARVQCRNPRKFWHVKTSSEAGFAGVGNRRKFIFRKGIRIKGKPVSYVGEPVGEVERRSAIARIT